MPSPLQPVPFNIKLLKYQKILFSVPLLINLANPAFTNAPQVSPFPSHLADSDDSFLGEFVCEDVEHVHAVSADDGEIHLCVLPNVSVGGFNSPNRSARLG